MILRTPEERFVNLPDYPFAPHYAFVDDLRIHYVAEGPANGPVVLLLHGEPSWSYLYRKMIPVLAAAGYRVIAPDLLGFGKSDKLSDRSAYSYKLHVSIVSGLIRQLDLRDITLFCQDWGGLLGLRSVAEMPERFARIIAGNTALPEAPSPFAQIAYPLFRFAVAARKYIGGELNIEAVISEPRPSRAFLNWVAFSQVCHDFPIGKFIDSATTSALTPEVLAAYDAPFPDESYKAAARAFPLLVTSNLAENHDAWERVLRKWNKPFLTTFSDSDPLTRGLERVFQKRIPGAKGQPHVIIQKAGHYLQEDKGEEIADIMIGFIRDTKPVG